MTVAQFLKLAPFSLGTITILLAAGGLIFGHAYGRYGDDAAIGFLLRWRFLFVAALVFAAPSLMLISFARDDVPNWLTEKIAALIVGGGVAATAVVVAYLLYSVSRPGRFLAAVGRRVTVRRLNRYALAARWLDADEFRGDVAARRYRWFGLDLGLGAAPQPKVSRVRRARWQALLGGMRWRRLLLRAVRTDPSEMLFDAAAAGLKNNNMRTWRSALAVTGRQLRRGVLDPSAAEHLVANAQALEQVAHRQGSEDCKVRLCAALGQIGSTSMSQQAAEVLGRGISSLAERRLGEHAPVLAAISALRTLSTGNPIAAARTVGWLGQHLVELRPPAAVYGFDGDHLDHPTRTLFSLLAEFAERADREHDGPFNDAVIDAADMISRKLPGQQDRETSETLAMAVGDAGVAAARRYGAGEAWHGTYDAVATLVRIHRSLYSSDRAEDGPSAKWIAEMIGRIGCWAIGNTTELGFPSYEGRSDLGAWIAQCLLELPRSNIEAAFVELILRQHNSAIPAANRDAFIGLCQKMSGDLLGLAKQLDVEESAG